VLFSVSTMRVKVKFFSSFREIVGQKELELNFNGQTAAQLWEQLVARFPELAKVGESKVVAVNREHSDLNAILKEGDEVAFFPPVSGG